MKFLYKQNYTIKFILLLLLSIAVGILSWCTNYAVIPMPVDNVSEYHIDILTINSIISGFALTNLGILLSIGDDQLIEKLKGTDILQKRNIVIGHSIIFGSISIFISMYWVLGINLSFVKTLVGDDFFYCVKEIVFYLEVFSLVISIAYFLLSIKKMIELLAFIHVPKKKYTDDQIEKMKSQLNIKK